MKYSSRIVSPIEFKGATTDVAPTILPQLVKYEHIPGFEADASKFAHPLVSNSVRVCRFSSIQLCTTHNNQHQKLDIYHDQDH
ncbi:hypothetical protein SeLEV6574_g08241 [Synchytrium endobioticum]|uniref:Uncharacterized protein n=1 Tax=Synchytrium endobioticum TaxID=286115 RepID=A0A507CAB0_9FUNG|nr:hypothetical protein SeLEV6574_g08241 [Synchytrium endobioticum]